MLEMWNDRYREAGYAYGTLPNDFLVSQIDQIKPKGKVLCLAEGEGRNALFLAQNGFDVTAVDFSPVGMEKLATRAVELGLNIETIVSDLAHFDMSQDKWDSIISIFAHLPPGIRRIIHSKVQTALRPGGILILEAYHPQQIEFKTGGPPRAEMMMSAEILQKELPILKPVLLQEIEREIHEGKYHNGQSAVVQFVGLK